MHISTSELARISRPRSVSTSEYSISGFRLIAWLAGMVHAVVVQITAKMSPRIVWSVSKALSTFSRSCALKATSMVWLFLSAYSISNSASDEPQSKHQYTGFRPR